MTASCDLNRAGKPYPDKCQVCGFGPCTVAAPEPVPQQKMVPEDNCEFHFVHKADPKICGGCGIHIDSLRPPEAEGP